MAYYYSGCLDHREQLPHFLDSCSLCNKPLGYNSDIFMYRGNTPFCSKECRQEQIEMDERKERKGWKSSSRSHRTSKSEHTSTSDSSPNNKNTAVRTGTVVVA